MAKKIEEQQKENERLVSELVKHRKVANTVKLITPPEIEEVGLKKSKE